MTAATKQRAAAAVFGTAFGFVLGWAHLTRYDVIHDMLSLREPDVFLLMAAAVLTGAVGSRILRALGGRTLAGGEPVSWRIAKPSRDVVLGSVLFGLGWSIAATCPGPAAVQIGRGQLVGFFTAAGLLLGVALRGYVKARAASRAGADPEAVVQPGL